MSELNDNIVFVRKFNKMVQSFDTQLRKEKNQGQLKLKNLEKIPQIKYFQNMVVPINFVKKKKQNKNERRKKKQIEFFNKHNIFMVKLLNKMININQQHYKILEHSKQFYSIKQRLLKPKPVLTAKNSQIGQFKKQLGSRKQINSSISVFPQSPLNKKDKLTTSIVKMIKNEFESMPQIFQKNLKRQQKIKKINSELIMKTLKQKKSNNKSQLLKQSYRRSLKINSNIDIKKKNHIKNENNLIWIQYNRYIETMNQRKRQIQQVNYNYKQSTMNKIKQFDNYLTKYYNSIK